MCTSSSSSSNDDSSPAPRPKPKPRVRTAPRDSGPASAKRSEVGVSYKPKPVPRPTPKPSPPPAADPSPVRTVRSTMKEEGRGGTTSSPAPKAKAAPKPAPKASTGAKLGNTGGPASEKMREVGVKYGFGGKAEVRKTSPSGDLARRSGISPGAVKAITGSDRAVANVAGRSDISKEQLGDLQTRAKAGSTGIPGIVGGALSAIGRASASSLLKSITEDVPTIAKLGDKPSYSVKPVTDSRTGSIVGVTKPGPIKGTTVYSGRPDFDPISAKQEDEPEPDPKPVAKPKVEEPVEEVVQMGSNRRATTKNRRGVGRRTAFGTRASLINLRNVR